MNIFNTILIITLASLGFRSITAKGMILYFIRKPFDDLATKRNQFKEKLKELKKLENDSEPTKEYQYTAESRNFHQKKISSVRQDLLSSKEYKHADLILYIMKPFLLCSTCMASVHTLIWYPILTNKFDILMIVVMFSVAFLNTLLWSIVEFLQKK